MIDTARLGRVQRHVLRLLDTPRPRSTAEVASYVLGRVDVEATRQVRRAVDSLAARGLVRTWTGPIPGRRGPVRWVELVHPWEREINVDALPEVWRAS